jgi:hypothetical protein
MINTMTGSPEMQPLMTVLAAALGVGEPAGRHVATLGYQRGGRTGPTGTEPTTMATRHLVERLLRSASRSDPSIGRCWPSFGTHGQDDCPRCPRHVAAAGQDHLALITVMITD